ncbi:hypothetical protein [Kaistia terrae]|uniref:Terminase small subunit n=1 Tax=Kaistia terrae TaxID=537017 RepID=A0ABW0PV62_9HYPH|nr:hypothetical protein [Kaistia terrae]MCX5579458.1 hypothetical protein [Kaistia terrae]
MAKGKTADEAYAQAGYAPNRGNATRMKANESIRKRVDELQGRSAKRVEVTVESLAAELEEARALALTEKQTGAAVSATMGEAKLLRLAMQMPAFDSGPGHRQRCHCAAGAVCWVG